MGKIRELGSFNQQLKYLTDLLNKDSFKKIFNEGLEVISFHPGKKERFYYAFHACSRRNKGKAYQRDVEPNGYQSDAAETKINGNPVIEIPYLSDSRKDYRLCFH